MNRQVRMLLISFALVFPVANAIASSQERADLARVIAAEIVKTQGSQDAESSGLTPLAGCTPTIISIPTTIQGFISTTSCYDAVVNGYEDIYTVSGVAGQTITVDYSSTSYETFIFFEGLVSYGNGTIQQTFLSSGVSRSKFTYTFTQTRTYKLELETLFGPGDGLPYTGPYALSITTTG